jgi:hypothetical protein
MNGVTRDALALCAATLPLIVAMPLLIFSPLAVAGFPLSTEDTGTLGLGKSKIEIIRERGVEEEAGARETSVTNELAIIHGLRENLNVFLALPYKDERARDAGGSAAHVYGVGDVKVGMKWRYFEKDHLSLALKALVSTPSGDDQKQLGAGKPTQSFDALLGYQIELWEFSFDAGYKLNHNTQNQRERLGRVSVAVERSVSSRWKVMADIGVASNNSKSTNKPPAYLGAGLSFALTKDASLDVGVKRGLTSVETDTTWLVGMNRHF